MPSLELGEEQSSDEGGFAFRPIKGYEVEMVAGIVTMRSPGAKPQKGPTMLLSGASSAEDVTLESLLKEWTTELQVSEADFQETTLADQPALGVDFVTVEDEEVIAGRVVVAKPGPDRQFAILAGAPEASWQGELRLAFEAVLASIRFFEPVVAVPTQSKAESGLVELRQWANQAVASSEYSDSSWNAQQATGAPDTPECGDFNTAWASETSDSVDWLELRYLIPVRARGVNIIQTYSPSQVVKVELIDTQGNYHEIYSATPQTVDACPFTLAITFEQTDYEVVGVKITIDQSLIGFWNEIDAVELLGLGLMPAVEVRSAGPAAQISLTGEAPAGFLWRAGGLSGYDQGQFASLGGMDVGPDQRLYVADGGHGVYVYDIDGKSLALISHPDLYNPSEVEIGPDGNIYVPAWGSGQVFIFSPAGELLLQFGEEGTGDGQFGTFSPEALAVAPDGRIYTLDDNEDPAGNSYDRIQVFSAQGEFLEAFNLPDQTFSPQALEFGQDGNLYLVGFLGGYILKLSPDGQALGEIGKEILEFAGPQKLAIDQAGNFYVTTWTPAGVMVLDPAGKQITQWGLEVIDGEQTWSEGGFYQPTGVAVLPDGSRIFASDWSGTYAYLTAFTIK
jgi:DNA-binding beta-propeller fold protein YncE